MVFTLVTVTKQCLLNNQSVVMLTGLVTIITLVIKLDICFLWNYSTPFTVSQSNQYITDFRQGTLINKCNTNNSIS